jgi:hypothetical protein
VRRRNSVFHDVLKRVPWAAFDKRVGEQRSDEGTRRFTSRRHLTALLFAQLSGAGSLREIEATMTSHQGRLSHCGAVAPKRSTFADANRNRDFRVFSGLFETMLAGASPRVPPQDVRRGAADRLDRAQACGGRRGMGAFFDLRLRREERTSSMIRISGGRSITPSPPPTSMTLPPPRRCRSKRAELMSSISAITTSASLAKLDALGCRLVTRFKANTPLNSPREMPLEPGSTGLGERIGFPPARQAMNRKTPMQDGGSARSSSGPRPARRYASSPTISTRPRRRSRICTSAAGGSSCSSA